MSKWLGYDPRRPVHVNVANHPGQQAILWQTAVNHYDEHGFLKGWSGMCKYIEGDYMASNLKAMAEAERYNNGMKLPHHDTQAEDDDG